MNTLTSTLISTLLLLLTFSANAQITVKAVQPPAWKQEGQQRSALQPGDNIRATTTVITGANARVQLALAEGSVIELGENTRTQAPKAETKNSLFEASIDMLKGAFRFTTATFAQKRQRSILINLPSSTIGIRGTDLWGRASNNSDFVVLIEGDIAIDHSTGQTVRLQTPASVYEARSGSTPEPVRTIDTPDLLALAAETALLPKRATLKNATDYTLIIGSFIEPRHAQQLIANLQARGYPAQADTVTLDAMQYTRVVFDGFDDLDVTRAFSDELYNANYISSSWITKNN